MKSFSSILLIVILVSCSEPEMVVETIETWNNGSNKKVLEFVPGKKEAYYIEYLFYETGIRRQVCEYRNNMKDGLQIYYYDDGSKAGAAQFKKGKNHGEMMAWYRDGTVKSRMVFENNMITSGVNFYKNGQIIGDVVYQDGMVVEGIYYHQNGTLRSKGKFKKGKKTGIWYNYDTLGVLKDSVDYRFNR